MTDVHLASSNMMAVLEQVVLRLAPGRARGAKTPTSELLGQ